MMRNYFDIAIQTLVAETVVSYNLCYKCLTLALRYPTLPVRPCAMDSCIIVSSGRVLLDKRKNT